MVCTHSNRLLHSNAFRYPEQPKIPFLFDYKSSFTYLVLNDTHKMRSNVIFTSKINGQVCDKSPKVINYQGRDPCQIQGHIHVERSRYFITRTLQASALHFPCKGLLAPSISINAATTR